ncbi:hypothetical protein RYX36_015786 [Vicia faba]
MLYPIDTSMHHSNTPLQNTILSHSSLHICSLISLHIIRSEHFRLLLLSSNRLLQNVKEHNGQQHLEAIIQDAKAEQIHVVTCSRDLDVWKNNLQENQTYMVYNGETVLYDIPMKVCDNKYKLFFNSSTTITAVDIRDIP